VSLRSFCTNNNAAYVAVEETYGDVSYNGHAKKGEEFRNNMTNFGILMEIKGIEDPFKWSRDVVQKCQLETTPNQEFNWKSGLYYSPNETRKPTLTSEGDPIKCVRPDGLNTVKEAFQGHFEYIENFILNMNEVFEQKKKQIQDVTVYTGVTDMFASSLGGSLLDGKGDFSTDEYTDLRQAYTQTLIPVTMDDYNKIQKFNNVSEYKAHREKVNVTPLTEEESKRKLLQQQDTYEKHSAALAFKYAQEAEKAKQKQQSFWGDIKQLTGL
jgi:hypothetical protein